MQRLNGSGLSAAAALPRSWSGAVWWVCVWT